MCRPQLIQVNARVAQQGYITCMVQSIHGHEVLHLMADSGAVYTTASLREAIVQRFGANARFHTCGAQGLSADGVIEFLTTRQKFTPVDGGFIFSGKTCAHGEDDA